MIDWVGRDKRSLSILTINEREEVNEPDAVRHDRATMVRLDNSIFMHAVKIHGVM